MLYHCLQFMINGAFLVCPCLMSILIPIMALSRVIAETFLTQYGLWHNPLITFWNYDTSLFHVSQPSLQHSFCFPIFVPFSLFQCLHYFISSPLISIHPTQQYFNSLGVVLNGRPNECP